MRPLLFSVVLATAGMLAAQSSGDVVLYAGVGAKLTEYAVDVEQATLTRRGSVTLPANIQYAWPHPSRRFLYVVWSNGGASYAKPSAGLSGNRHGATVFRVEPGTGALLSHGPSVSLPSRPIHVSTDMSGSHLLVAYNDPSGVTVHQITEAGALGLQVTQPAGLDTGIYAHQVRVDPSNRIVILVTRGNGPAGNKPEDPGGLKVFGYQDGLLSKQTSIAPGGGYNFQPRHLDFHPTRPWAFVSLERQGQVQVYEMRAGPALGPTPLFTKNALADPAHVRPTQNAGTVHVHPSGRFVYQATRATGTTEWNGKTVFAGGENSIAVYSIDPATGEPALIQNADTRGISPRTFALDPSGRILVAANQTPLQARNGARLVTIPASLAVFRVGSDGKLDFARKYDIPADGNNTLFWMGIMALPGPSR